MGSIIERERDNYYNTSVLIDDKGKILGKYRKIHLWCGEKDLTAPGKTPGVFKTRFGTVGIEICWDLAFPELSKRMALNGARMIFCPTLWTHEDRYSYLNKHKDADLLKKRVPEVNTEEIFINSCVAARAVENNCAFILVNGCGKTKIDGATYKLVGNTQITLPFYGRWKSLTSEETLLTAELDTDLMDLAEEAYHSLADSTL